MKKLIVALIGMTFSGLATADIWAGDIENSTAYLYSDTDISSQPMTKMDVRKIAVELVKAPVLFGDIENPDLYSGFITSTQLPVTTQPGIGDSYGGSVMNHTGLMGIVKTNATVETVPFDRQPFLDDDFGY